MTDMFINEEFAKKLLSGFSISDCAIDREKGYGFVLTQEQNDRQTLPAIRVMIAAAENPMERRFNVVTMFNMSFPTLARGIEPKEYVVADLATLTYSSDRSGRREEKPIDKLLDLHNPDDTLCTISRVVRAAGKVYAIGGYRCILRREGVEQWVNLRDEGKGAPLPEQLPAKDETSWALSLGFNDLAAFAADDMYAVGGYGDVWRFDGKRWLQCAFPSNAHLETVCCGDDSRVYISDQKGKVWAGRENRWELLADSDLPWGSQPIDAVWFADRLILGGWGGLFALDGKELVPLQELEPRSPNAMVSGRLDVSPCGQFLLTAGPYGACLYDGQRWTRLFSMFDFD
ncbi:hypothetical protein [Chitinibacter sp. GC72]|uniref:hypothetical protein n=1 Tax=Chitinibacter sp. GC72 TaxID=1526917 RepID=UPI0012FB8E98|nr:hypothetical protein [Chitinibacter sp. GC72]